MRKFYGLAIALLLLAPAVLAQEHYTEGPVWRVILIRVKPNHVDEYLASLQKYSKAIVEEEKKEGLVLDYKVFVKETKHDPQDWDICVAWEYKNHAALDGLAAKEEAVENRILGGSQQAQQVGEQRETYRELVSDELLQEIFLK